MNQVLLITKNVLAEQKIQQKLQGLNYEVYCSTAIPSYVRYHPELLSILNFFQYAVLSESLSDSEMTELVVLLKKYPIRILRKVEKHVPEKNQGYLEKGQLDGVLSTGDSMDELRECFSALTFSFEERTEKCPQSERPSLSQTMSVQKSHTHKVTQKAEENIRLTVTLQCLSPAETKVLIALVQSGESIMNREQLCQKVWQEGATPSHLASLSTTIARIKQKFERHYMKNTVIHTVWGKGYYINQDLFNKLEKNELFNQFIR